MPTNPQVARDFAITLLVWDFVFLVVVGVMRKYGWYFLFTFPLVVFVNLLVRPWELRQLHQHALTHDAVKAYFIKEKREAVTRAIETMRKMAAEVGYLFCNCRHEEVAKCKVYTEICAIQTEDVLKAMEEEK